MDKAKASKIAKITFLSVFIFLLTAVLLIYIFLNIYVSSKGIKVERTKMLNDTTVELTDEQLSIINFIETGSRKAKFKRLPLIMDAFSRANYVAYLAADCYVPKNSENKTMNTIERHFVELGTWRYIVKKIPFRDCCNYVMSNIYYGYGIIGLNEAAKKYYNKIPRELTKGEFISLYLVWLNPSSYDLDDPAKKESVQQKVNEIMNDYEKKK